ncbi:recombinase family protein [Nocardia puris]|uniref:DNA invertase Pin-like site-specific DNA recombinase n=1 Tax=Nocardia puris TaxID=208602 RepID=A0A366DBV9_9NOCA|nr:recombinase family protein [Nocardia puris]RBO87540.1 DNA invertase Pin-like site-specific DNA recombinase [Nocardia puris]
MAGIIAAIKRAIIYTRVSKDDQGGRSCREQEDSCRADCEYEGWIVAAVLEDNDRGATRHSKREREAFKQLPDVLQPGDVLVVWEPSRITRNMNEFAVFCELVTSRGVMLYYDGRVWDLSDDDDRNRVWQDILDGAKAAGKTRKRVLRAMKANLAANKPHGKLPPCYRVVRDPATGKSIGREIDEPQARILREIAAEILDNRDTFSLKDLSRRYKGAWEAAGRSGNFRGVDIKRFLLNPSLYGMRTHNDEIVGRGTWEPVFPDLEQLTTLKTLLSKETPVPRGSEPRYLLTHIALCSVCLERGMDGAIEHKGPNAKFRAADRYTCLPHGHVTRSMKRVDDHIEELLLQLLEDPETSRRLRAVDRTTGRTIDDDLALIEQLTQERKQYLRDAARTRMSATSVAIYVEELEQQMRDANARIAKASAAVPAELKDIVGPNARQEWAGYTVLEKRTVLRLAMRVVIHPIGRRGRYTTEVGLSARPVGLLAHPEADED